MNVKPSFQGEIMLAGWQESHTAGAKITFWLPDAAALEPFKGMTAKKGNTAGQRFMAVLVEVGDDDQPIVQHVEPKAKGGALAKLAGMWCNDLSFYQWIRPIYDIKLGGNGLGHGDLEIGVTISSWKEFCRHAILVFCDIKSRSELDSDDGAAERFHSNIRLPYAEWFKDNREL